MIDEFGQPAGGGAVSVRSLDIGFRSVDADPLTMTSAGEFGGKIFVSEATSVGVRYEADHCASESKIVRLTPGVTTSVELVSIRETKYQVRVTRENGTPIEGARVAIGRLPSKSDPATDESGIVQLALSRTRPLGCWAIAPDGTVGKSELTFPMPGDEVVWDVVCNMRLRALQVSLRSAKEDAQRPVRLGIRTASPLTVYDTMLNGPSKPISVVEDGMLQVIIVDPAAMTRHKLSWSSVSEAVRGDHLNIELDEKFGVRIRATNERGDPLAGVALGLERSDGASDPKIGSNKTTDNEGRVAWDAAPGEVTLVRPGEVPTILDSFTVDSGTGQQEREVLLRGWLPIGGACRLPPTAKGVVVLSGTDVPTTHVVVRDGKWLASAPGADGDVLVARLRVRGAASEERTEVVLGRLDNVLSSPASLPIARLSLEFGKLRRFSGYLLPESDVFKPRRRRAYPLRQTGPLIELVGLPPGTYHFSLWRDPLQRSLIARSERAVYVSSDRVSPVALVRR